MSMISKRRGTGYEYRIRDWFINEKQNPIQPIGWQSERNALSRIEKSFGEVTAKHDVKAWKDLGDARIFLQIEAKKTGKDIHTIQKEWIDKIDWHNDELLVIALQRTDHFAVLDVYAAYKLFATDESVKLMGKDEEYDKKIKEHYADKVLQTCVKKLACRGGKSVRVHKEDIESATLEKPVLLNWENINRLFYIIPLADFVKLREQRAPNVRLEKNGNMAETNEIDIPTVQIDPIPDAGLIITCPYTNKPIKLLKKSP